ncbi:Zinc finger BED domain-containing protein DAYSLEEPER [Abeliophyllum distichum]|uniref:Zinc finger BED domain-containing protein DAYSLEEPER n=1 Tax=Abeliophyllum distichum TaxID=126358 RepID=A0ABD1TIZ9_9LAMI
MPASTDSSTTSKGTSFFSLVAKKKQHIVSTSSTTNTNTTPTELEIYYQFDHYSLIPPDEVENLDVLEWWRLNERSYPVLSKMARDLLTVPVSTVASESAFSAANMVLDERRSRLKEDILEALVCIKDWLFADRRMQDKMSDDIVEDFKNLVIADD